jgi:hypothetical protein
MALDLTALGTVAGNYASREPQDILELALKEYAPDIGIAFSGAEDVALVDMATRIGLPFKVFVLDTGRLHPETYQFIEKVRTHYGITIEAVFPQPEAVQTLVREKGLFSFYVDGHKECCGIRKVEPLMRALGGVKLLILDDWGLEPLGPEQRHDMLEIVEDRYGRGATLITSQIPVDRWHDLIGEPTLADAILDRIIHNAHRLQLRGDSLRKQKAPKIVTA